MSAAAPSPLPEGLEAVTAEQPAVAATLAAALAAGPTHAYALIGPAGSGKRAVARAFAAELLAEGSDDPGGCGKSPAGLRYVDRSGGH